MSYFPMMALAEKWRAEANKIEGYGSRTFVATLRACADEVSQLCDDALDEQYKDRPEPRCSTCGHAGAWHAEERWAEFVGPCRRTRCTCPKLVVAEDEDEVPEDERSPEGQVSRFLSVYEG